jgi:hypothetical protein
MAEAQASGDVERAQAHNLAAAAAELLERAAAAPTGRAPLTLSWVGRLRSNRRCWRFGGDVRLANMTRLGQRCCRCCRAGCGWWRARRAGRWVRATTSGSRRLGIGWRAWRTLPSS